MIFYRSEAPPIDASFRRATHLLYRDGHNPVDDLIRLIPGIRSRASLFTGFIDQSD